ncbi:uncharacterized protein Z518_08685 [Rhinocladiella mackenziei CBS 650.93]|uniref:Rhinocladiella mackenziei CBS 650.93 unplaced genomic scaffold supercont1.6, whole genome shotgun sequence n=1 Tax=Rhinocladiella mackenziei CBS 650.93 TaxID=1442369 RepID=A0A0D2GWY9_9EURO|nr:uncharacterized protein Z518_08685 [Rhinocladiella mackenziei CBS 650.93]KIX02743.1 hypothetical protein Z518_08685 [Rhinocladiella mackenziei CBS 650.93]
MSQLLDASTLKDKSVIITGGASGIGLATATHFAKAGAYVTIADVQDAAGESIAADLVSQGGNVSFVHCDTSDWEQSVAAFKHAAAFAPSKTLDVALLSAGIEGDEFSVTEQALAAPEPSLSDNTIPNEPPMRAVQVNLCGVYKNAWLALYYMRLPSQVETTNPPSKSLIFISSFAGYADMPSNTDYNTSKFGVRGIFRGLRHTTTSMNVRTNLIAPLWINTPILQPKLAQLAALGVKPGAGLTFASIDHVVNAVTKSATDETVSKRVFFVVPEGFIDAGDDEAGGWAADCMREQWKVRRSKGDIMP